MGGFSPPGGFNSVDVAVCTIEKGNSLVNRLIEEKNTDQLGKLVCQGAVQYCYTCYLHVTFMGWTH